MKVRRGNEDSDHPKSQRTQERDRTGDSQAIGTSMMRYHFYIHTEKGGRWAQCVELPGCVTEGDTEEELWKNMKEAPNLYLSEPEDSRQVLRLPKARVRARNVVRVPVE